MDDLIVEFLTETNESLEELDLDLVNLEQNPNDKDLLGKIFRLMHTIKGTCGFLNLPRLEKVAHHAENVLGRFRDGDLEVTADYVTLIFESIDRIKLIVGDIEETGSEQEGDDSELIEKLDIVFEGRDQDGASTDAAPTEDAAPAESSEGGYPGEVAGNVTKAELDALEAAFQAAPGPAIASSDNDTSTPDDSQDEQAAADQAEEEAAMAAMEAEMIAAEEAEAAAKKVAKAAATPAKKAPAKAAEKPVTNQTLRVNVDVLENLMSLQYTLRMSL